jgi:hypothetical protein
LCALKATVLSAVQSAKVAVDDLKISAQYVKRGAAVHVPGSAPSYPETLTDVYVVMTRFESREVDNDRVMASDWKGLVFYEPSLPNFQLNDLIRFAEDHDDLKAGDYRITYNDQVTVGGRTALHQLYLRRA